MESQEFEFEKVLNRIKNRRDRGEPNFKGESDENLEEVAAGIVSSNERYEKKNSEKANLIPQEGQSGLKFKHWVSSFFFVELPIGELSRFIGVNPDFPDTNNREEIEFYLVESGIVQTPEAQKAFGHIWDFFEKSNASEGGSQQAG